MPAVSAIANAPIRPSSFSSVRLAGNWSTYLFSKHPLGRREAALSRQGILCGSAQMSFLNAAFQVAPCRLLMAPSWRGRLCKPWLAKSLATSDKKYFARLDMTPRSGKPAHENQLVVMDSSTTPVGFAKVSASSAHGKASPGPRHSRRSKIGLGHLSLQTRPRQRGHIELVGHGKLARSWDGGLL